MSISPRHGGNSPAKSANGSVDSNISAMLHLKNNRKRAENDLQLLSNRVALLRSEEERALNKIEETKHRAKEILVMKKKNEDKLRARTAKMMSGDEHSRAAKLKVAQAKKEREERLNNSKKFIEDNRKKNASYVKEMAIENKKLLDSNFKETQDIRKQRAVEGKKRKDKIRKEKERERAEKERSVQLQYAKKMAEEARKTKEAEDLIAQLEKQEMDLIESLKKTQTLQTKAFQTLQTSLDL